MAIIHKCNPKLLDQPKKYCEAIMNDLLLFTQSKEAHYYKLGELLKALCKNGLKISPK